MTLELREFERRFPTFHTHALGFKQSVSGSHITNRYLYVSTGISIVSLLNLSRNSWIFIVF